MSTVERHPDDLPPPDGLPPSPGRRRLPPGILWAGLLAVVTLTIAVAVSWGPDETEPTDLDARAALPADDDPDTGATPGSPAPEVSFATFDGTTRSLADYRGTPLVLNFWASTCIPCTTEMPDIDALHTELDGSVTFVGINTAEGTEPALRFLERVPVDYELGRDPDGSVLRAFGRANLPTTVIIDADGTVGDVHTGIISRDDLRSRIEAVTG